MSTLAWLPESLDDLARLYDFLAEKNPQAARRAIRCIRDAANLLGQHPEIGAPMLDASGRRQVLAPFGGGAYVLRYRLTPQGQPVVIRVWHTREAREDP